MALLKVPFKDFLTIPGVNGGWKRILLCIFFRAGDNNEIYNKIMEKRKGKEMEKPAYGFFFYVPLFFLLSFAGWLWEAAVYMAMEGELVNRGALSGPWLPIYGCGGILLSALLKRFEEKPVSVFFLSLLLCSALEYLTSFFMERMWGIRWWDYSNEFLNISGRICLWSSLMFGLAGWLFICYMLPYLKMLYRKAWKTEKGRKILQLICLTLILFFTADAAWAADFPNMGKYISG